MAVNVRLALELEKDTNMILILSLDELHHVYHVWENGKVGLRVASLNTIELHYNIYRKIFVSDFMFVFDAIIRII